MCHRFFIALLVAVAAGGGSCGTAPKPNPASVPAATGDNYDPWYYVVGEIGWPGGRAKLAFESAITVRMAINSAGGFSSSANGKKVRVFSHDGQRRLVDCTDAERNPEVEARIQRGDYIYVPRASKWPFW